jgi:hypothetical protein
VYLPEGGEGRRELEVPAEALEARAMREALDDEVQVLLGRPVSGLAQVEALSLPALSAADVDVHAGAAGRRPTR